MNVSFGAYADQLRDIVLYNNINLNQMLKRVLPFSKDSCGEAFTRSKFEKIFGLVWLEE